MIIHLYADPKVQEAERTLRKDPSIAVCDNLDEAEAVVSLGGDGHMLKTVHMLIHKEREDLPIYGLNYGSKGFMLNSATDKPELRLRERIQTADLNSIKLLEVQARNHNTERSFYGLNEAALLRSGAQSAHVEICVNGKTKIQRLIGDGVLVATETGSSAYNLSAHGTVLPLNAGLVALTPICPYSPRRWRGAVLPNESKLSFKVLDQEKRGVNLSVDYHQYSDVSEVEVTRSSREVNLLFDAWNPISEKLLAEAFDS